jgi:hypothetical protein
MVYIGDQVKDSERLSQTGLEAHKHTEKGFIRKHLFSEVLL